MKVNSEVNVAECAQWGATHDNNQQDITQHNNHIFNVKHTLYRTHYLMVNKQYKYYKMPTFTNKVIIITVFINIHVSDT